MSCPTSDLEFPGYLKNLLKSIENGNDDELKKCACSLHILEKDGCISLDEDGKMGAFPFCVQETSFGDEDIKPGFSQKDIMQLFWRTKSIKAVAGTTRHKLDQSLSRGIGDQKRLVCAENNDTAGKFYLYEFEYLQKIHSLNIKFPIYKMDEKFYFKDFDATFVERIVEICTGCYPKCCPCFASAYLTSSSPQPGSPLVTHNRNKMLGATMSWGHIFCQDAGANFSLTPEFWA